MTREEAIKRLKEYAAYSYGIWHDEEEDTKAFDMAIEALSAERTSTSITPVKRYCRRRQMWCYHATEFGECSMTAFAYPYPRYTNATIRTVQIADIKTSGKRREE